MATVGTEIILQEIRGDVSAAKQRESCLSHCRQQGWHITTVVPASAVDQTVALIEQNGELLVVMAYVNAHSLSVEERVLAAGGKVAYCRAPEGRVANDAVDTGSVILYLYRKGRAVPAIAEALDVAAERVRQILHGRGFRHLRE